MKVLGAPKNIAAATAVPNKAGKSILSIAVGFRKARQRGGRIFSLLRKVHILKVLNASMNVATIDFVAVQS